MGLNTLEVKLTEISEAGYQSADVTLAVAEGGYSPKAGNGVDEITETLEIYITGANAAAIQTGMRTIGKLLETARYRSEEHVGHRVYLMARVSGETNWWQSEILDGRILLTETGVEGALANGRADARLTLTRDGFFSMQLQASVWMSNPNSPSGTNIATIFNCADESGAAPNVLANYVLVAEEDIQGDLPAPVYIQLTNKASVNDFKKIFIGRTLQHEKQYNLVLSRFTKDFVGTADATCAGGSFASASLSTNNETTLFSFSIPETNMMDLGGDLYHILARFRDNGSLGNVKFRLQLLSGSTVVWKGPQIRLENTDIMQDLGVANLPPGPYYQWDDVTLAITGQRTTAVTETVELDFLQFFGREFVKLKMLVSIGPNQRLDYGGRDQYLSSVDATGYHMDVIAYGADTLTLRPGQDNAFWFLVQSTDPNTAAKDHKSNINMVYHPRRSTL